MLRILLAATLLTAVLAGSAYAVGAGPLGPGSPTPAADVAALLGHADPRICVAIYSRPSPESLERAVGRLAGNEEDDD